MNNNYNNFNNMDDLFNQLMGAQNRSVKTMMPLRRLQPTLNNRHPASEILMLCGE